MADLKVLSFNPKPKKQTDRPAKLPDEAVLNELLLDKPMKSCLLITINDDGVLSYWVDQLSTYEAVGLIESTKLALLGGELDEEDFVDE